jgi:hypothetical protein
VRRGRWLGGGPERGGGNPSGDGDGSILIPQLKSATQSGFHRSYVAHSITFKASRFASWVVGRWRRGEVVSGFVYGWRRSVGYGYLNYAHGDV